MKPLARMSALVAILVLSGLPAHADTFSLVTDVSFFPENLLMSADGSWACSSGNYCIADYFAASEYIGVRVESSDGVAGTRVAFAYTLIFSATSLPNDYSWILDHTLFPDDPAGKLLHRLRAGRRDCTWLPSS